MTTKQIVLASRPTGEPTKDAFRFEDITLQGIGEGELLVKGVHYSVDPYMRGRMSEGKSYIEPFEVDQPIVGGVVAEVLESRSADFKPGDFVLGMLPWATQALVPASSVSKVDIKIAPGSYYLGILGMPGLTAFFGLMDIGKPKAGETVVVSGAAGAVGVVVGQIAKIQGCRVVGIVGSDEKADLLKKDFGFDEVINYRTSKDIDAELAKACPNGVDVYFDNVGGDISDAVFSNINVFARIVICGQIALYNKTGIQMGPRMQQGMLTKSVLMQGFLVFNYQDRYPEGMQYLAQWIKEGKLKFTETTIQGFERLPEAFLGLFNGENRGKMIVNA